MSMNKIGNQNMERQTFHLPPQMNNIASATIIDTTNGDVLFCHDQHFLYAAKITKQGGNVIFQRFNLPGLERIFPIIRNYFSVIFVNSMLVVFEVWFNEENKVMLKYAFNKMDRPCFSFFLRQVVQNMAELQLSYPENDVYVYQFTVNGKVGHMDYTIGPQNKIKFDRQQLYGSKTMLCTDKKALYYFTNFSSKSINAINLNKFQKQICQQNKSTVLLYICLPKIQEHYVILSNLVAINIQTPSLKHKIQIQEGYIQDYSKLISRKLKPTFKVSSYFDMFMIEDSEINISMVFHVKQKGSALVAVEYGKFNWFWTSTRKIIGLSKHRNSFKVIDNLSFTTRDNEISDQKQYQQEQKRQYMIHHQRQLRNLKKQPQLVQNNEQFIHQNVESQNNKPPVEEERENDNNDKSQAPVNTKKEQQIPVQNFKISKQQLAQRFVPSKVIQKKGVNISKSISKPKQIEPISKSSVQMTSVKKDKPQIIQKQQVSNVEQNKVVDFQQKQEKQKIEQAELKIEEELIQELAQPNKQVIEIIVKQEKLCQIKVAQQVIQQNLDNNNQLNSYKVIEEVQKQQISIQTKLIQQIIQSDPKISNQDIKQEPQKVEQGQNNLQDNLTKNVALMMQKQNIAGQPSTCSINRNKIFNLATLPCPQMPFDNPFFKSLKKYQSQTTQYYNPLLSPPPLLTPQKQNPNDLLELSIERKLEPVNAQSQSNNTVQNYKRTELDQIREVQLINKVKELFQSTTTKLLSSIQTIATSSSNEPYLKERVIMEVERRVMETLRRQIGGQFTVRVQSYFKQIFRQTSSIQQQSLKFYKEATHHKSGYIQVQLNNQQKILQQIKQIQSMLRFSITNLRLEGKQTYQNLIRDWAAQMRQAKQIVTNLTSVKNKLEEDAIQRNKRYEQTKKNLEIIKNKLIERAAFQEQRRLKKIEKTSLKLKQQQQKKKKQKKNTRKPSGEKQKRSKVKRSTNE